MSDISPPQCVICESGDVGRFGVPVDSSGRIIENADPDDLMWAGMPCCERCYHFHAAVGAKGVDALREWLQSGSNIPDIENYAIRMYDALDDLRSEAEDLLNLIANRHGGKDG